MHEIEIKRTLNPTTAFKTEVTVRVHSDSIPDAEYCAKDLADIASRVKAMLDDLEMAMFKTGMAYSKTIKGEAQDGGPQEFSQDPQEDSYRARWNRLDGCVKRALTELAQEFRAAIIITSNMDGEYQRIGMGGRTEVFGLAQCFNLGVKDPYDIPLVRTRPEPADENTSPND